MDELIAQLDKWIREYRADFYQELNPPATKEEIEGLEKEAGEQAPLDFKKLLLWKNGQSSNSLDTFHPSTNEMYVSSSSMIDSMKEMKELLQYGDIEEWKDSWVPFMDNGGGDVTCIDFKTGEIVTRDHETEELVIKGNIRDWIEELLDELSTKNFEEWDFEECHPTS